MAGVSFASEDVRYKGKKVPELEDVEMESVPEEAAQVTPAPRFECASL